MLDENWVPKNGDLDGRMTVFAEVRKPQGNAPVFGSVAVAKKDDIGSQSGSAGIHLAQSPEK
jgi:hypothetical protein